MKPTTDLSGMYRSFPAYLWVEDEETRTYLETVWPGESLIKLYVAGGHKHIGTVVHAAHQDFATHVFGLRDRDFTSSNRSLWLAQGVDVFAGDCLEVENLMLDPVAIAECDVNTSGLDATAIKHHLCCQANTQVAWMACRRLISDISEAITKGFIEHPKRSTVLSHNDALRTITNSDWYATVLPPLSSKWPRPTITATLDEYVAQYEEHMKTDAWQREFSGKELLRELRGLVWTKKQRSDPEGLQVFVRSIAEAQLELRRVPDEAKALREVILSRIGRA